MDNGKVIKIIVSMIGLDGHTVGGEVVSGILRDAGMEVVFLGIYQTPEMIVQTAIQEDVDAIAISSHASNYNQIEELIDLLIQNDMGEIPVFCGGTIPKQQIPKLKAKGVAEVITPGTTSEAIVNCVVSRVKGTEGRGNKGMY